MEIPKFTYRKLKAIIDTLNDEQLDKEVIWAGEGRGGKAEGLWIAEEDQINPSGDGMEPISSYVDDLEFNLEDENIVCTKDTPILLVY
jgi:hypothetical protein